MNHKDILKSIFYFMTLLSFVLVTFKIAIPIIEETHPTFHIYILFFVMYLGVVGGVLLIFESMGIKGKEVKK